MMELLAESSIRSAILAGGVGLLLAAFRVRQVAFIHRCWALVLAGTIVMPLLVWSFPGLEIPILPSERLGHPGTVATTSLPEPGLSPWSVVYLAVASILAFRVGVGYLLAVRMVRSAVRIDRPGSRFFRKRIRYFRSADVSVPMTFGWLRPVVLLPEDFERWSGRKLRAVLEHEHAHIARWDFLTNLIASSARVFYWPNPLSWWIERRLAVLAEMAADEIAAGPDRTGYAELLLEIAGQAGRAPARAVAAAGGRGLAGRITELTERRNETMTDLRPKARIAFVLLTAALVWTVSAVDVTHASAEMIEAEGAALSAQTSPQVSAEELERRLVEARQRLEALERQATDREAAAEVQRDVRVSPIELQKQLIELKAERVLQEQRASAQDEERLRERRGLAEAQDLQEAEKAQIEADLAERAALRERELAERLQQQRMEEAKAELAQREAAAREGVQADLSQMETSDLERALQEAEVRLELLRRELQSRHTLR